MKTPKDPRHKRRQSIVKALFSESFMPQANKNLRIQDILSSLPQIDKTIELVAPEFPIEKINKIDLAILRLGVYELSIERKNPPKVIIDEAVELAKEFGNITSAGFINGALGKLIKTYDTQV